MANCKLSIEWRTGYSYVRAAELPSCRRSNHHGIIVWHEQTDGDDSSLVAVQRTCPQAHTTKISRNVQTMRGRSLEKYHRHANITSAQAQNEQSVHKREDRGCWLFVELHSIQTSHSYVYKCASCNASTT
mmetsp:Transcript_15614/g.43149  ORF Transcript_15614/g.43149 Transcript_15614/m.43149 type:complete len:130 (+) Transcript_15614:425-814(+)